MKRFTIALALVLAAALAFAGCACADDTEVGAAVGTVKPLTSTTIRMDSETVQAILYSRFAEYRVDFNFVNSGAPQRVTLGFPFPAPVGEGDQVPPAAFRAWQDGTPLPVTVVQGKDGPIKTDFYTHTVDVPPGKTTVTVDYLASPTWSAGDVRGSEGVTVSAPPAAYAGEAAYWHLYDYTLHTGANWAGTIGKAVLRYTLSKDFVGWGVPDEVRLSTYWDLQDGGGTDSLATLQRDTLMGQYARPSPGVYQWTFRDLEPTTAPDGFSASDIGLTYLAPPNNPMPGSPNRYVPPVTTESSSLKLDGYEYTGQQISDGVPSTAWAENVPGPGIGQWVNFAWPTSRPIREIRVLPGYAKTPQLFYKYNRPKRLRFTFSDGTDKTVELADEPSLQRFPVNANARSVRMTIEAVYPGTTRNETYVSEVEFGRAPAPQFVESQALLSQTNNPNSGSGAKRAEPGLRTTPGGRAVPSPQIAGVPQSAVVIGLVAVCGLVLALAFIIAVLVVLLARKGRKEPDPSAGVGEGAREEPPAPPVA